MALPLAIALAYLAGSIPFGLLLTRLAGLGDIRTIGSGNIGATNVLRTGRTGLAALTVLLDAGKGAGAVLVARAAGHGLAEPAAIAVVVGHIFPIWLRFKGGKGVATAGGALLAYLWPAALAALATWFVVAYVSRYSSLAAIAACALAPAYAWLATDAARPTVLAALLALLVLARHRGNMVRLIAGTEGRIGVGRR